MKRTNSFTLAERVIRWKINEGNKKNNNNT